MRSDYIIAATFSTDAESVREAVYQPTRTRRLVYAIGDRYYAVSKTVPTDAVGTPWRRHSDQFFAERAGTVLWVCDVRAA